MSATFMVRSTSITQAGSESTAETKAATEAANGAAMVRPRKDLRNLRNQERDGGRDAHAREANISLEAARIAEQIAAIAGYPDPKAWPPGWCGAPLRVEMMLNEGWRPVTMLAEVRAVMANKRGGPPESIRYFEKAFARAHARDQAPLPKAVPLPQTTIPVEISGGTHGGLSPNQNGLTQAARDYVKQCRSEEAELQQSGGGGAGGISPVLLPPRRGQ